MTADKEFYRGVDHRGRVVLPIDVRRMLDIQIDDALEISADQENGQIIIKKIEKSCLKCHACENLKMIRPGFYLCSGCISQLSTRKIET